MAKITEQNQRVVKCKASIYYKKSSSEWFYYQTHLNILLELIIQVSNTTKLHLHSCMHCIAIATLSTWAIYSWIIKAWSFELYDRVFCSKHYSSLLQCTRLGFRSCGRGTGVSRQQPLFVFNLNLKYLQAEIKLLIFSGSFIYYNICFYGNDT